MTDSVCVQLHVVNLVQTLLKHTTSLLSPDLLRVANTRWTGGWIKVADLNGQTWDQSPPRDLARSKWVELGHRGGSFESIVLEGRQTVLS